MSDFMLILLLLYCWPFSGSALVFVFVSEKPNKNKSVNLFTWEFKLFICFSFFLQLLDSWNGIDFFLVPEKA